VIRKGQMDRFAQRNFSKAVAHVLKGQIGLRSFWRGAGGAGGGGGGGGRGASVRPVYRVMNLRLRRSLAQPKISQVQRYPLFSVNAPALAVPC